MRLRCGPGVVSESRRADVTVAEVLDRRRAVLRERMRIAEQLGQLDIVLAADIVEQLELIAELYRALLEDMKRDAS